MMIAKATGKSPAQRIDDYQNSRGFRANNIFVGSNRNIY